MLHSLTRTTRRFMARRHLTSPPLHMPFCVRDQITYQPNHLSAATALGLRPTAASSDIAPPLTVLTGEAGFRPCSPNTVSTTPDLARGGGGGRHLRLKSTCTGGHAASTLLLPSDPPPQPRPHHSRRSSARREWRR